MPAQASAGARGKYVTLRLLADAVAASGFPTESSPSSLRVWAERNDLVNSGWSRERFAGDQLSARMETSWKLPYVEECEPIASMTKRYELVDEKGVTCDIVIASEIGQRQGIELTTTAKVD